MIRIEITCDHSDQPRARDARHPCDSLRARSLEIDAVGTMDQAAPAVRRVAADRGWTRLPIPALGRRKGYVCPNCRKRYDGEI